MHFFNFERIKGLLEKWPPRVRKILRSPIAEYLKKYLKSSRVFLLFNRELIFFLDNYGRRHFPTEHKFRKGIFGCNCAAPTFYRFIVKLKSLSNHPEWNEMQKRIVFFEKRNPHMVSYNTNSCFCQQLPVSSETTFWARFGRLKKNWHFCKRNFLRNRAKWMNFLDSFEIFAELKEYCKKKFWVKLKINNGNEMLYEERKSTTYCSVYLCYCYIQN